MAIVTRDKFDIDEALDSIDLTFKNYIPSVEAFEFFNLIRIFMGEDFEIPNPKFHYLIVDLLLGNAKKEDFPYSDEINNKISINYRRIGIIATRGSAKSTVTTLFYPIYAAIKGSTKVTGPLSHMLILSDSQKGGARDQALIMGNAFEKSKFAKEWFEKIRFTESEVELVRKGNTPIEERHMLIKFKGAQALSLDSRVYMDNGISSIAHCQVGDKVFGADGKLCTIIDKSEVFYKPMYKITLRDGRELKVSDDHINSVMYLMNNKQENGTKYKEMDVTTKELLDMEMWKENKTTGYKVPRLWIKNTAPVEYTEKELPIDPYTLGLILGDGYFHSNDYSVKLTGSKDDMEYYFTQIPYEIGYIENRDGNLIATIKGISPAYQSLGLHRTKANNKYIPQAYKIGSIEQRLALLQGLIDTDGTIAEGNRGVRFMTTSDKLCEDVMNLVRSLGGIASYGISNYASDEVIEIKGMKAKRNYDVYRVYIHLDMEVARLPRKKEKLSFSTNQGKVPIVNIEEIEMEESQCIKVDNEDRQFLTSNYTRTHNSGGIRSGSRNPVTGDRYAIIIADDVIKNESEAYSDVIMHNVTTALTSDALNAMRAKKTQLVLINTPFHKQDPIYRMVESGGFTPLVVPICKEIYPGMSKEEFEPLWEDMHDYESVMERYLNAVSTNSTRSFNQELMLRVASEEDRMITDDMIQWYDRPLIMKMIEGYSIYITTDFTTTSAAKSDFSALAVWAISSNNDYFLLDACVKRQELQEQYNELFRMVSTWSKGGKYIEVGIEIDGQQKAHLFSLKEMMQKKGIYFSFARQKGGPVTREGILSRGSGVSKLERFRYMLPMFQNRKFYFPEQMKNTPDMKEALKQLKGATHEGFSTHDDFCDCISQLNLMDILPGSGEYNQDRLDGGKKSSIWANLEDEDEGSGSSIVF